MRRLILGTILLSTCFGVGFAARLSQVKQDIAHLKADIAKQQGTYDTTQRALNQVETQRAQISLALRATDRDISQLRHQVETLHRSIRRGQAKLNDQQSQLAQSLKTAYKLGREPYLQLVLNEQDPNKVSLALGYYKYLNRHRIQTITSMQHTLSTLLDNEQALLKKNKTLTARKLDQLKQRRELNNNKAQREKVLAQIGRELKNKQARLDELVKNRQRLTYATTKSTKYAKAISHYGTNFARYKGHLHWPVSGHIDHLFGIPIHQSEIAWQGDLIYANSGSPVRAVAPGVVVFARWLQGYGLLMIVNHGHGYMTIYGRNQSLLKKVGDHVQAGEAIATVGNSGGFKTPALYFAIRHGTKPLNPRSWCRTV